MFDFAINESGDIVFDTNKLDIHSVTDDALRTQNAMCRIKSVSHDWFIDHIGADLEAILGQPNTQVTTSAGVDKIIESLTFDNLYSYEDIYIETKIISTTKIKYVVYLRTIDQNTATVIDVTIDLVKGVNVRIGGN